MYEVPTKEFKKLLMISYKLLPITVFDKVTRAPLESFILKALPD
jgi:hypothetical protein